MIINIAGTSGAGKTAVVRRLIAHSRYAATLKTYEQGEIGRIVHLGERSIFIAGRYDDNLDSGGCDCIKDIAFWYNTVWNQAQTHDVVFEGLFVMNHTRGLDLTNRCVKAGIAFHVIHLTTSLDMCKESINERRARRGQEPFTRSWDNVEGNVIRARNFTAKVKQLGATVYHLDRAAAAQKLMELFDASGT
jgi:hypothetical protein